MELKLIHKFESMNVRLSKNEKIVVLNTDCVSEIMQKVLLRENQIQRSQEHFWIIGLDNANKILFIELVALGVDNRVFVKPYQVFKMAIYKNASKMILVHNHPSGTMKPSEEDIDLTNKYLKIGLLIQLEIIDHLIISEKEYFSFSKSGLIDKLKNSKAYQIVSQFDSEIEDLKLEAAKNSAVKVAAIESAKVLLKNGIPHSLIREVTNLTIRELNKVVKDMEK